MNSLLNLSEALLSPEFLQTVKVYRNIGGYWEKGKFIQEEQVFREEMVVCTASDKEIEMLPEGDRIKDAKTFHCLKELFITQDEENSSRTSDMLEWKGHRYKIITLTDNSDYGYYKAYAVKVRGY